MWCLPALYGLLPCASQLSKGCSLRRNSMAYFMLPHLKLLETHYIGHVPWNVQTPKISKMVKSWFWAVAKHILKMSSRKGHRQNGAGPRRNPNSVKSPPEGASRPPREVLDSCLCLLGPAQNHYFRIFEIFGSWDSRGDGVYKRLISTGQCLG